MSLKHTFIISIALFLLRLPCLAQVTFSSVEDTWRYADTHNITVRNATYELDKTAAARKQAYMAFAPQVTASANFTNNINLQTTLIPAIIFDKNAAAGAVYPAQFGQKYIYQGGVTAQLDLLNLQTWYNVQIVAETEAMNKASLANVKKNIYQQLAAQYYSYLLMKEAARLAGESREITDSVYLSVEHKLEEGTVNESIADLAKINKERAEQTLITAQYQAITALNNIKALLNLSLADSIQVNATLGSIMEQHTEAALTEDPVVRQAYYQARVAMSRVRAANAAYIPVISASYSSTTQQNDNKLEPFQNGPAWYPASFLSLRATWNIFTGGTRWLQSKQNKITYYESTMQYEAAQKQAAINDENLRLAYMKARAVLEKSGNIMKLSADNYTHITNRYEAGIATIDDRLNAFSDYINYQNQYLNSLSDALVQLYLLKIRQ